MPLRPARMWMVVLAGLVLATGLVAPVFAQTETPVEGELRPALPADPAAENPAPADAAEAPVEATQAEDPNAIDLERVEASLTISRERIEALRAEIAAMEGDAAQQNAALIAAGQRVQLAEIEIGDVEQRLGDLIGREMDVRGRLDGADREIANVLAALERISLNPPPALIVDPGDALGSARGAMLIAAILPQLRARADAVATDLEALTALRQAAMAEEQTLRTNHDVLEEEQLRIATLIAARNQGVSQIGTTLATEESEAVALAERAETLRELISALSRRAAEGAAAEPEADPDQPSLSPEAIELAFADATRTQPAIPFSLARGYLVQPANGVTVLEFGANDGRGGISQGQSIVTRAEAEVLSPADGFVLYRGAYLNYGQIVILNTGSGFTALLAGLDSISVDIGQFVQMGAPIGTMGSRTSGRTVTTSAGNTQPTLYIELRQSNEPFDPAGWWANTQQTG
jgi:murein hydrolase activator